MTTARPGAGLPASAGPVPAEAFFSRTDDGACPGHAAPLPGRRPPGTTPSGQQDPPGMTGPAPGYRPGHDDLTARVFRALYPGFDLRTVDGTHIAVLKGHAGVRRTRSGRGRPPDRRRARAGAGWRSGR
jgi:hypothetical protein